MISLGRMQWGLYVAVVGLRSVQRVLYEMQGESKSALKRSKGNGVARMSGWLTDVAQPKRVTKKHVETEKTRLV